MVYIKHLQLGCQEGVARPQFLGSVARRQAGALVGDRDFDATVYLRQGRKAISRCAGEILSTESKHRFSISEDFSLGFV